MTPYPHQVEGAQALLKTFREHAIVYIAYEERVGKSLTALLMFEQTSIQRVLILTKKTAIEGWLETVQAYDTPVQYTVTNYEQAHKYDPVNFDAVLLDEAHHALASYPKPSQTWKKVRWLCKDKPLVFASATPHPETLSQVYHQLALSDWSPFAGFKSFYAWHREYGIPNEIWLGGRRVQKYDRIQEDRVLAQVSHLFHVKTRKEVGFEKEPEDKLHYVALTPDTEEAYAQMEKNQLAVLNGREVAAESAGALMQKLAQLVGGTMINGEEYFDLENTEKIDYIKKHFGDSEDVVIMYNYKREAVKLATHFKRAKLLQADRYAEGVDLHKYTHLIVYSMSFRTSKYIQRRARQANMKRVADIIVHYVLSGKIDNKVYEAVALKKQNFTERLYRD